jgi:hypothetical protein
MLVLSIALAAAPPVAGTPLVAADVAGMEPQLSIIRRDAAERGWRISCEGRSGEERVIRIVFPTPTSQASIAPYFDHLGSSMRYYSREQPAPEGCDQSEPQIATGSAPVRMLEIGPRSRIEPLVSVARACGYAGAALRERRPSDSIPAAVGAQSDWLVIDPGEDATARYGPLMCWIQMRYRAMTSEAARSR